MLGNQLSSVLPTNRHVGSTMDGSRTLLALPIPNIFATDWQLNRRHKINVLKLKNN